MRNVSPLCIYIGPSTQKPLAYIEFGTFSMALRSPSTSVHLTKARHKRNGSTSSDTTALRQLCTGIWQLIDASTQGDSQSRQGVEASDDVPSPVENFFANPRLIERLDIAMAEILAHSGGFGYISL